MPDAPAAPTADPAVLEMGKKLLALCQQGENLKAIDTLYAGDVVSVEAAESPGHPQQLDGKAAVRGKTEWWVGAHEVHAADFKGPFPHGERFALWMMFDVTPKEGPMAGSRMQMEEIGLYTVKDGKIAREQFMYHMPGLPEPASLPTARKLVELCGQGQHEQAIGQLYAEDVVNVEAGSMAGFDQVTEGKAANLEGTQKWVATHEIHGGDLKGPYPAGDRFAIWSSMDVTPKEGPMAGQRMQGAEVGVYTVNAAGKISRVEWFYDVSGCGEGGGV